MASVSGGYLPGSACTKAWPVLFPVHLQINREESYDLDPWTDSIPLFSCLDRQTVTDVRMCVEQGPLGPSKRVLLTSSTFSLASFPRTAESLFPTALQDLFPVESPGRVHHVRAHQTSGSGFDTWTSRDRGGLGGEG